MCSLYSNCHCCHLKLIGDLVSISSFMLFIWDFLPSVIFQNFIRVFRAESHSVRSPNMVLNVFQNSRINLQEVISISTFHQSTLTKHLHMFQSDGNNICLSISHFNRVKLLGITINPGNQAWATDMQFSCVWKRSNLPKLICRQQFRFNQCSYQIRLICCHKSADIKITVDWRMWIESC